MKKARVFIDCFCFFYLFFFWIALLSVISLKMVIPIKWVSFLQLMIMMRKKLTVSSKFWAMEVASLSLLFVYLSMGLWLVVFILKFPWSALLTGVHMYVASLCILILTLFGFWFSALGFGVYSLYVFNHVQVQAKLCIKIAAAWIYWK